MPRSVIPRLLALLAAAMLVAPSFALAQSGGIQKGDPGDSGGKSGARVSISRDDAGSSTAGKAAAEGRARGDAGAAGNDAGRSEGTGRRPSNARRDAPPAGNAPAARPGGQRSRVRMNEFRLAAGADTLMLRLAPEGGFYTQDLDVIEGDEFATDLIVMNDGDKSFDRIRLVIDYNPSYVTPLAVNDAAIADFVRGTPVTRVDRLLGQVIYEASLDRPLEAFDGPLMFIRWRALAPVFYMPIGFGASRDGFHSDVMSSGESVLGTPYDETDGTVSVGVRILPEDPEEAAIMAEDPNLYMGSTDRVGGVELAILGPEEAPRVGEMTSFDIYLDNSVYSQMDGISIILSYDPTVLQIYDTDYDNWITLGHNIEDGPFREEFPFDYHLANTVYPSSGMIEYRVAASLPDDLLGVSGTIARIHAKALRPVAHSEIDFLFAKRRGERTTKVQFLGQDALGDSQIRNDGVEGTSFSVLPAIQASVSAEEE